MSFRTPTRTHKSSAQHMMMRPRMLMPIVTFGLIGIVGMMLRPGSGANNSASSPVAVFCERSIMAGKADEYKHAFAKHAHGQSLKAIFAVLDKTTSGRALEFTWYNDASEFASAVPKGEGLLSTYTAGSLDVCQVFGSPPTGLMSEKGVSYEVSPANTGFLRPETTFKGPSVFFISTRVVASGDMSATLAGAKKTFDWWLDNVPGVYAAVEYAAPSAPKAVRDLRVMANFEDGFVPHADTSTCCAASPWPEIFEWFGAAGWNDNINDPYTGVAFGADGVKAKVTAMNPANGIYEWYTWDEIIGPAPTFA